MKLKVLDLFAGIAGFSLGLHRAGGYETVKFCEMKPHAQRVLAKNFPSVPCHDDVTTYDFKPGEADVITAGFPCQDISFAGDGAGLAGARSGLYREVIRAIRVVRPLYAILENVAALLSRGLDVVLGDMAEIGYDAEWHCIPASAVGAPHRRDRIWIIADAGGEQYKSDRAPFSGPLSEELSRAFARNTGACAWDDSEAVPQHPDANSIRPYRAEIDLNGGSEFRNEQIGQLGSLGENVAHAEREQRCERYDADMLGRRQGETEQTWLGRSSRVEDVADANTRRELQSQGSIQDQRRRFGNGGQPGWAQWSTEPDVGRVAHGVPMRVDRLAELGNAVVPQIPEIIGRAVLQARAA